MGILDFSGRFKSFEEASLYARKQAKETEIRHVIRRVEEDVWVVDRDPASKEESSLNYQHEDMKRQKQIDEAREDEQRMLEVEEERRRINSVSEIWFDENGLPGSRWEIDD